MPTTPQPDKAPGAADQAPPTGSDADGAHITDAPQPAAGAALVLAPGQRPLPDYELVVRLGRGGCGEVWKAKGPGGFDIALKFILLGEPAGDVELRALELIKGIRHAHLLPLFGAWQRDDRLIIAMELADRTLHQRWQEARGEGLPGIPTPELLEHMREAARGLDYLNEDRHPSPTGELAGIVHRDVKPENLLLVGGMVKVGDCGLARLLEHTIASVSQRMTWLYAAPEFFNGQATRLSDQYSLAVTYCQLRGGKFPFGENYLGLMAKLAMNKPPDLSMLPEAERPAVARALAREPTERWPSCGAFAEELAAAGRPAPVAPPLPPPVPDPGERDARLQHEGEELLARHYREALERTRGKPTAADRDAFAALCRGHGIPAERANAIIREVRTRWQEEHPRQRAGGEDIQAPPAPVTGGVPPPVTLPPPTVLAPPRPARGRRGRPPLPCLLAVVVPLAGAAVLGLVLLAALYRGPAGAHPETSPGLTGLSASAAAKVVRDTGRPTQAGATAREGGSPTSKEASRPAGSSAKGKPVVSVPETKKDLPKLTERRAEVARPRPLDCTGADGVSAGEVKRAQEAWALYLGRQVEETVEIADGAKMTFVLVPPGTFRMGSPSEEQDYVKKTYLSGERSTELDDETLHVVTLTEPFYLAKTEVTQAQYKALTGKTPSHFKGNDLPVETVSWKEARDYAARLTEKRDDKLLYRLPTEAEWEYSCRGGRPSSQPFGIGDGKSLSSREANFIGTVPYGDASEGPNLQATCRVGSYPANALGLFDMHGNVSEWCADRYGPYPPGDATNPPGPAEGSYRVYRGGSWTRAWSCRAACRTSSDEQSSPGHEVGFRLARSLSSGRK
jgi:formylglycine-generating enzyme required for sulfatase activity